MTNRNQRRAAQAKHNSPEPTPEEINYLVALFNQGNFIEAESFARKVTVHFPRFGFGWKVLGAVLKTQGRTEDSLGSMQKASELMPGDAQAQSNLGVTLKELGRLEEAESSYRRALKIKPDYAEAHSTLGNILKDLGRLEEAEACFRRALMIVPDYAEAHCNLGVTIQDMGRLEEAESCYRCALDIKPDYENAFYNLGNALRDLGRMDESEVCLVRALEIKPDFAEAHNNLGNTLKELGRLEEAEASYGRALNIEPEMAVAHSNLLFSMNYDARHELSYQLEEACRFGQMVTKKVTKRFSDWQCKAKPERLRVGLVSGDLINHPVGYFLNSVLSKIDRSRVELVAYTTDTKEDDITACIKPFFSGWKSLVGKSDEAAARFIHSDGIHILIDLSGHTAHNRLPVFAWKPAPVQATWLGYLATTGVAEIDYLIGDPHATPPENDRLFSETVWRLPDIWGCFTPPVVELETCHLPALSAGYITFGCFNNLNKMNDDVVALWARVLTAVPGSRLFLKTKQLDNPVVCEATQQRFAVHGIEFGRLILEGASPRAQLLAAYNRVDIVLDPFPYTGGTTNFEVLWMAVPVITRKGDRFIARGGQSIVHNAGLDDWIAENDDDYVAKAVIHTTNLERLARLRAGLREQVLASPLFDAVRFAKNFEDALWGMWEKWEKNQESLNQ